MLEMMFCEMPEKDVISWSTLIMGYVQGGQLEKGLECFREMREKGLVPNEAILVTVLSASAQLGLLEHGQLVHFTIRSLKFRMSVAVGTALIDVYAKCGCIDMSRQVFKEMPQRDVWSWNVMICGLATHGLGKEALELFQKFINEGLHPVNVTFVGVLNGCSRSGIMDEGRRHFKLMTEAYGIELEMEHYGCMVDLLGRAGFVAEALELIEKMTIQPDPVLLGTLLGACKIHGLVELGEELGRKLIELDPTHDGHYVLLANIYAKARKWEDVVKVRQLMVDRGANKVAGWSLIEAKGKVHRFIAGDREHERSSEIYKMINVIDRRLAEAGYSPDVSPVLHDIGKEEK
ncbi:Pentatricopeptide repeat [Macleaya cordata]|uniref:Pentatricopeptide repeat n=1 Tax=Macleaya cordata TaxID=56857 RepID=A0A200Q8U0_MACCD|nr:Pentatricopeptide repeat [Macleaya cordata]